MAIVMLGLAGLLLGGAVSMRKQGASTVVVVVLGVLAAVAAAAGVLWMLPRS
ncbi:MAG TPA: hypothetical protein VF163_20745 [Micromonosporaceae bacterium]